ncbi:hypothetical protein [Mesorhizobium sp. AA22]|uniref:hypothetical protein n=1 Tax=Mesorhizobium sp. AA22 TaxID=1854057 RepID=UPI0007EC7560|nr:hypothetical protein [Mesorhizobium sp. AA22]
MGTPFGPNGLSSGSSLHLIVEISQIIVHEASQPDSVLDLFDADGLTGKDEAEIDILAVETDLPAGGDGDGLLMGTDTPDRSASSDCVVARAGALNSR